MDNDVGDVFHKSTKYSRGHLPRHYLDWTKKPNMYKNYSFKKIPLKFDFEVSANCSMSFIEIVKNRHSVRAYADKPVKLSELAYMLWTATGIRKKSDYEFRMAPSAGALYPIETYIIANNVEGLQKGVYHYDVKQNELEELRLGNFEEDIARAALDQEMCAEAQIVFVLTAIFARTKWKYLQRGYRSIYIEAGHIAQNLALSAVSVGLGSCQISAFYDDEVNAILGIDGQEESTVYLSTVGHPL